MKSPVVTCIFDFYDPLPCLNVKVVCGPRVLVVVHRRRKDHGKDLELSQPVLHGKGRKEENKAANNKGEGVDILGDVHRCVKSIDGKRQDGKEGGGKAGQESNKHKRKGWTEIREEK